VSLGAHTHTKYLNDDGSNCDARTTLDDDEKRLLQLPIMKVQIQMPAQKGRYLTSPST
jgi:hypothetical protein